MEESNHPTFRRMDVVFQEKQISVDFNEFEVKSKKTFRVARIGTEKKEFINFSSIKPTESSDQPYLDYVRKEYELIAIKQITADKKADKELSGRRA